MHGPELPREPSGIPAQRSTDATDAVGGWPDLSRRPRWRSGDDPGQAARTWDVRSSVKRPDPPRPLPAPSRQWDGEDRSAPGVLDWRSSVSQYIETIRPKVEDAAWGRVF